LTLAWMESGGPAVAPPTTKGFGTKIITATFRGGNGEAEFDWRPEGLKCTINLPCQPSEAARISADFAFAKPAAKSPSLGRRILLVEDEPMVGMFMYDLLEGMGLEPSAPIGRLAEAMKVAETQEFDGAILDINIHGELVYPLAELLAAKSVPVIFVTGYASESIDPRFADNPVLQKPIAAESLEPYLARGRPRWSVASAH